MSPLIVRRSGGIYSTAFPLTENPISEGGHWISGNAVGLDWADYRTTPGLAFGTQTGSGGTNDSTALLTTAWGANQSGEGIVHTVNQQSDPIFEEVAFRFRSSLSAHRNDGYEVLCDRLCDCQKKQKRLCFGLTISTF